MNIKIKAHKIETTTAMKEYVEKKMSKLERFFDHIQDIIIDLDISSSSVESETQVASATVLASGATLRASESSANMYSSIDMLMDKLEIQLKKHKEKLREHKRNTSHRKMDLDATAKKGSRTVSHDDHEPRYIRKPMSPEEAALVLEEEGLSFVVFRNSENEKISVVYPKNSQEYGLIIT